MTPESIDLTDFVRTEYPRVIATVGLITGDRSGAADAVQDAIERLLARPPVPAPRNVAAWITVVACNRTRDIARTRAAEINAYRRLGSTRGSGADPSDMSHVDVLAHLGRLPMRQRQIAALFYMGDHSVTSIAESMALSEGTIKTHLHRARQSLSAIVSAVDEVPLSRIA